MAGYFFIALEDTGLVITVSVASHSGIPGHVPGSFLYNNSSMCGLSTGHLLNVIINRDFENIWSVNIWFSEYKNRLAAKRTIGDEILFRAGDVREYG